MPAGRNGSMNLTANYTGKKVFITGHTGFKGSWLIAWLNQLGAIVKGYALNPENDYDLYNAIRGNEICESVIADIRDKQRIKKEVLNFQPDFIFHLAAQPLVRLSYEQPLDTFEINAQGTANLLEALRFLDKPCVAVMITTDKVYHNVETGHYYKEEDRLGGYDPYSASKACAELLIDSYRKSFFNPASFQQHQKSISVARAGNVIGGGDWAKDRIIPDIIRALSIDKPVVVRNAVSVRPWQHVLEPLHGYLILAAHQHTNPVEFAEAFNFGPLKEDNLTVGELVKKAILYWGKGSQVADTIIHKQHEAGLLRLDITKATTTLNWKPKYNAEIAILKTIDWYRMWKNNGNVKNYTDSQIRAFMQTA